MESVRIAGHRYSDPDVLSLIQAAGKLVDPRSAVLNQARRVNAEYRSHDATFTDPLQRIKIIASLAGIQVKPMNIERRRSEPCDAVLIPTASGQQILYNPDRPPQRVAFSIAHEVAHTFFPTSTAGARFRNIHTSDSKEANELERLCDLGAAELLMPIEDFRLAAVGSYGLAMVERCSRTFGSSFEATAYRMASAHPGKAVAGLLKYRLSVPEQRAQSKYALQGTLFSGAKSKAATLTPKYRRQSLYLSEGCSDKHYIPWNKSFDVDCIAYQAVAGGIVNSIEELPNSLGKKGRLEAVLAPYQRGDAHPEYGDVLFFWEQL